MKGPLSAGAFSQKTSCVPNLELSIFDISSRKTAGGHIIVLTFSYFAASAASALKSPCASAKVEGFAFQFAMMVFIIKW